jgi:protein-tyrosine-phosphatase
MSFADPALALAEVMPDPNRGALAGFEQVLDLLEAACAGLIKQILKMS